MNMNDDYDYVQKLISAVAQPGYRCDAERRKWFQERGCGVLEHPQDLRDGERLRFVTEVEAYWVEDDMGNELQMYRVGVINRATGELVMKEFGNTAATQLARVLGSPPWSEPVSQDLLVCRKKTRRKPIIRVNLVGAIGVNDCDRVARWVFRAHGFDPRPTPDLWADLAGFRKYQEMVKKQARATPGQ